MLTTFMCQESVQKCPKTRVNYKLIKKLTKNKKDEVDKIWLKIIWTFDLKAKSKPKNSWQNQHHVIEYIYAQGPLREKNIGRTIKQPSRLGFTVNLHLSSIFLPAELNINRADWEGQDSVLPGIKHEIYARETPAEPSVGGAPNRATLSFSIS